ncbi:hypothetical protein KSP24_18570 [Paenibacillus sp. AK121]|uniref:hypothetical protein n=1 Tax=Paenibacillus TaxID=44249 RepID=UPI000589D427|nr:MULTISPECIES: hypothetical protein [Paenibacillus]AJE51475.1 hypothetical protein RE92_10695 [Paenibacillus polymyxa]MBU9708913.1 hypothetical protein [Paenibacillus sp. AK121]MEE4569132.1 hypothetical protein [Paenibacillus polymyxa]
MNYMDEHILSLKNKLNYDVASNNVNTSLSQTVISEQDHSVSEKNLALRLGDELITLELRVILDGQMQVSVPKSFSLMLLEQAKFKYPSEYRPEAIYTSEDGTVNITFSRTESFLADEELPDFVEQMVDTLRSVQPIRNWLGTQVIVNHSGLSIGLIRFVAAGVDTNLYNEILLFTHAGQVMMGTFNCMESDMEVWLPVAENTVQSLHAVSLLLHPTLERGVDSL